MAVGGFILFLILAAVVLMIRLSIAYDGDSPSATDPVAEAERRFRRAFALGFGEEREAAAQRARVIALSAGDERLPRPKLGADAAENPTQLRLCVFPIR